MQKAENTAKQNPIKKELQHRKKIPVSALFAIPFHLFGNQLGSAEIGKEPLPRCLPEEDYRSEG